MLNGIEDKAPMQFASELPDGLNLNKPWIVLAVDDDIRFQESTTFALEGSHFHGRPVQLLRAYSMAEASTILASRRDIAVLLLDVVMESDDAGLRLVRAVREVIGNAELRIVLVTGEPGMAPVETVMRDYDINDYYTKSELSSGRLHTLLSSSLRAYEQFHTVAVARRGLQLIVESSSRLQGKRDLRAYSTVALEEIAALLGLPPEGLVLVRIDQLDEEPEPDSPKVIESLHFLAAAGQYRNLVGKGFEALGEIPDSISTLLLQAINERRTIETSDATTLFFDQTGALADFVFYIETVHELDVTEHELLSVFAANLIEGLHSVALISRLDRLAYQDKLLRIGNRNALLRGIEQCSDSDTDATLVLLDIDDFGGLNHAFGNNIGDAVLAAIAARLQQAFPSPSLTVRVGSDVFAVLGGAEQASNSALRAAMAEPFEIKGAPFVLTACYAAIPCGLVDGSSQDVLRRGLLALKRAKARGPDSNAEYAPEQESDESARFELLQALVTALKQHETYLAYQPQVDLRTGRVVGVEALMRWKRDGVDVPPNTFIPLAEASAHIHALGARVVAEAAAAQRALAKAGFGHLVVSVNVSARQFERPGLVASIIASLAASGVPTRAFCLEVTESAAMNSLHGVASELDAFRQAGGSVSIDDFGTGLSSLSYLQHLPSQHLKIDCCFVSEIDSGNPLIAGLVIELAHGLGMEVVAEGIETETQAAWLRQHGCEVGQGWLFGRPLPLAELLELLTRQGTASIK